MPELICPVCKKALVKAEKVYRCESGHSFDIARSGYVNLLPPSAGGKRHGDDKLMVAARAAFLNKGYYDPLAREIAECVNKYAGNSVHIADAGCGEGKYTADVLRALTLAGKSAHIVGVDISKDALIFAAKRSKELTLCAASSAALPLADGSADILLNIFSPFMRAEFLRVLKSGGKLLRVVPLERHLFELKRLIYDKPYENDVPDMSEPGFRLIDRRELRYNISLDCNEDIMALFQMTPYYYKTGAADQQKAAAAQALTTQVEFCVLIYEKD